MPPAPLVPAAGCAQVTWKRSGAAAHAGCLPGCSARGADGLNVSECHAPTWGVGHSQIPGGGCNSPGVGGGEGDHTRGPRSCVVPHPQPLHHHRRLPPPPPLRGPAPQLRAPGSSWSLQQQQLAPQALLPPLTHPA
jgi:hypothetical protein